MTHAKTKTIYAKNDKRARINRALLLFILT